MSDHPVLQTLHAELSGMAAGGFVVGLSGGLDSVVVLRGVLELGLPLRAIHVHHGLSAHGDEWARFCRRICGDSRVELEVVRVLVARRGGESLEERARAARYEVFEDRLREGECLLLGHHLDDQMETLMLRLMRGAGPKGLGGMPRRRPLGRGALFRPLLDLPRRELQDYAASRSLRWITDDSNADPGFDRNFCRQQLLPLIESRWPGYRRAWSKSIRLNAEAARLLDELAEQDLEILKTDSPSVIRTGPLLALSRARQRNVLRFWLHGLQVAAPGWRTLNRLTDEILTAREDRPALLRLGDRELRRFRDELHLLPCRGVEPPRRIDWEPARHPELELPGNGVLTAVAGGRLRLAPGSLVSVSRRQGGEQCRLAEGSGKGRSRSLKKILQESGMPPWLRERLPLIYVNGELAYIPGIGACQGYATAPGEEGIEVRWKP